MMKKFLIILGFFIAVGNATPTWMWIGTYYMTPTETCGVPLDGAAHANNFWNSAVAHHPGGPNPNRYVNAPGKQMNITNLDNNSGYREWNDFLFLMAHGDRQHMAIWSADQTYTVAYEPPQWQFGSNYTRWIYFQSCKVLEYINSAAWWDRWDGAFNGAQACLGYRIEIPAYSSAGTPGVFWEYWAANSNQMSLWNAHCQATYDVLYNAGWDAEPASITSKEPNAYPTHYFFNDTYNVATSMAGTHQAEGYQYSVYEQP